MAANRPAQFGDLLRRYRRQAGLTQEQLAERANLSVRAISELERGARQHPYRSTVELLAGALALAPPQQAELERAASRPAPPNAAPTAPTHHNLPLQLTSFIGRSGPLAQVSALLRRPDVRLLTLTGPPGSGKTRLSLEAAAGLLGEFKDGVFFVELAPVVDPDQVAVTIAGTLRVKESADHTLGEELRRFMAARQMLLVLDNFEQVVGAAPLLIDLLQAAAQLKLLVSSRAALNVRAEKEYAVPPLELPSAHSRPDPASLRQCEAVQLFVERARDGKADFDLTADNAVAVAEICRRLDGLPLALELAAARVKMLAPPALLGRLQSSLGLLTGGDNDLPSRQRTLRAAIAWSYELLAAPEQDLLMQLGVFAGGCTLDAIERVCGQPQEDPGATLDIVGSLVGKNLLQQRDGAGQQPRFALLETIREYAREKLVQSGRLEELRQRHALYFTELVGQIAPSLWTQEVPRQVRDLEPDYENLRAALEWALRESGGDAAVKAEIGLRLSAGMWRFWDLKGNLSEGRDWLESALEHYDRRAPGPTKTAPAEVLERAHAWALLGAGSMAGDQDEYDIAAPRIEASLNISRRLGDSWAVMAVLLTRSTQIGRQGDFDAERIDLEEALSISRALSNSENSAAALNMLGSVMQIKGDFRTARTMLEESLAISRAQNNRWLIATTLIYLGEFAHEQLDLVAARAYFTESLAVSTELGNVWDQVLGMRGLASIALTQGRLEEATTFGLAGLDLTVAIGDQRSIAHCLAVLAGIAAQREQSARRAAILVGATEALLAATNTWLWTMQRQIYEQAAVSARQLLGVEQFEAARSLGRTFTTAGAIDFALLEP